MRVRSTVMARGDRREPIYQDDGDRLAWLDYLDQVCRRAGWRVYGWVLMGNHYHLLVETPGGNLVRGMQWLQTAYTVWFNRRHGLSGHLFGRRYKAVLIDEGEPQGKRLYGYVGTVLDYLHLNPVRAGIVGERSGKSLLDYRWSSLTGAYLCSPRKRPKWDAGVDDTIVIGAQRISKLNGRNQVSFTATVCETRIPIRRSSTGSRVEGGQMTCGKSLLEYRWSSKQL